TADLLGKDLVEIAPVENSREGIDQRELLGRLASNQLAQQFRTRAPQRPSLIEYIDVEKQDEDNKPEEKLWKVLPLDSRGPHSHIQVREHQRQEAGRHDQDDQQADRPQLPVAALQGLNLLQDLLGPLRFFVGQCFQGGRFPQVSVGLRLPRLSWAISLAQCLGGDSTAASTFTHLASSQLPVQREDTPRPQDFEVKR